MGGPSCAHAPQFLWSLSSYFLSVEIYSPITLEHWTAAGSGVELSSRGAFVHNDGLSFFCSTSFESSRGMQDHGPHFFSPSNPPSQVSTSV
eukprot:27971_4